MTIRHPSHHPTTPLTAHWEAPLQRATAALTRAYHRPHSRLARPARWVLARLICYPIIAASAVVAVAGARDPAIFHDVIIDGLRVRDVTSTPAGPVLPLPTVDMCAPDSLLPVCQYGGGQ